MSHFSNAAARIVREMVKQQYDPVFERVRERCEEDFSFFARYFFKRRKGAKMVWQEGLHDVICEDLKRVWRGEVKNYILNCPPRYSKTELVVVLFNAWTFMKNPRCETIHTSYSDVLVLENSQSVREIVKSAQFQAMWPTIGVKEDKDTKSAWGTTYGGIFLARPSAGPITGFGAGRLDDVQDGQYVYSGGIFIDDPLKPDDARSDKERERVNNRWHDTIKSRRNTGRTPTVVCMQRLHPHDFTAARLEDGEEEWFHRVLPALIDENQPHERALWPFKHSVAQLRAMRDSSTVARQMFGGQMQQRPRAMGGNLLRGEWFRRYRALPQMSYRVIYGDTAQKKKEANDYTCFQCWGCAADGSGIYLLDLMRERLDAPELIRAAYRFWHRQLALNVPNARGHLRQMKIEDKVSGTGLIQTLSKKGVYQEPDGTVVQRQAIPVVGIQRDRDKFSRVCDASPWVETGNVWIPEDGALPWVTAFVAECEGFTADDTHDYDDQVDPLCDAVQDMLVSPSIMTISTDALAGAARRR